MNSKRNEWKVLELFIVAAIAALFTSTLSQATVVKDREIVEPTIENRLAKVRERLKQNEEQIRRESDSLSSLQNSLKTDKDKTIQAQWPNYWNDWNNWRNGPWSDWSNWRNGPWNDWSDWSNWRNY